MEEDKNGYSKGRDIGRNEATVTYLKEEFNQTRKEIKDELEKIQKEINAQFKTMNTRVEKLEGGMGKVATVFGFIGSVVGCGLTLLIDWLRNK